MKSKGFTLIELMIVVAIIAIIAAIAIPNLLRSRMAANETAAAASCKAYAEAQDIYRRTDWDKDGILEYAQSIGDNTESLFESAANGGQIISLVDQSFAGAENSALASPPGYPNTPNGANGGPKSGYAYNIETSDANGAAARNFINGGNMVSGYGCFAIPDQYDGTGRNSFQISNAGTIYQADENPTNPLAAFTTPPPVWIATE